MAAFAAMTLDESDLEAWLARIGVMPILDGEISEEPIYLLKCTVLVRPANVIGEALGFWSVADAHHPARTSGG
jgi:hypothetical protein